ncbi:hypothetical protein [Chakrabartyella piscis]|uniref:hypothetical protein n=1 Tax=Chakrabartyella piscis TaxID=2918914 RepID=UPI002958B984|nr:hypothetical protein [Chakrabartyella piscis]
MANISQYTELVSLLVNLNPKNFEWESDFDYVSRNCCTDIINTILEISKADSTSGNKVIHDFLDNYFDIYRMYECKYYEVYPINRILNTLYHRNEESYQCNVFCDKSLIRKVFEIYGSLIVCGEVSQGNLKSKGVLNSFTGWVGFAKYLIKENDSEMLAFILSLIGKDEKPYFLFSVVNWQLSISKPKSDCVYVLEQEICLLDPQYSLYLKYMLLKMKKESSLFQDAMYALDNLSITEQNNWFRSMLFNLDRDFKDEKKDVIEFLYSKYADYINDEFISRELSESIMNIIQHVGDRQCKDEKSSFFFIKSNVEIVKFCVGKLNFNNKNEHSFDCCYYLWLCLQYNDYALLDDLLKEICGNRFLVSLDDIYRNLLTGRNAPLSKDAFVVFKTYEKFMPKRSKELLLLTPSGNTLDICLKQIRSLKYTEDVQINNVQSQLLNICTKVTIEKPSCLIPIVLECVKKYEKAKAKPRFEWTIENERHCFYWIDIAISVFNSLVGETDIVNVTKLINTNDQVKAFIAKHYLKPQNPQWYYSCEIFLILERAIENRDVWSKEYIRAFLSLLYPDSYHLECEEVLWEFFADSSADSKSLLNLKLGLAILMDESILSQEMINMFIFDFFVRYLNLIHGQIPIGGNDVLFYALSPLIKINDSNINLKINEFISNIIRQDLVATKVQNMLSSEDFATLIDIVPSLKHFTIENEKIFNRFLRMLLNDYLFDNIIQIIGEVTKNKFLTDSQICTSLQKMLLLKKDVTTLDITQVAFLLNIANMLSESPERKKLIMKLKRVEKALEV